MTREEAFKGLKENICAMCAYGSQNMDTCDIRGCDNRDYIKALEQKPCDDCISRQAVLDIFAEKADATRSYSEAWETVKKLPPVNPQKNIVNNGTMNITL